MGDSIYDFKVKNINGKVEGLSSYKDKVLLIVNIASECGFTPQYKDLEEVYLKYKDKGFTILGFPCNQFGKQEPGDEKAIKEFCEMNYHISFPLFSKIEVNGEDAIPLYKFLKKELSGILGTEKIKWNFTKFLIDKSGVPFKRYAPPTKPHDIEKDIEFLLKK
jgi:glutathione peroxidase